MLVMNLGGAVADETGRLEAGEGSINPLRLDRGVAAKQLLVGSGGIVNPLTAEVQVIVRNHGHSRADAGELADQTSLVSAFCMIVEEGRPDRDPGPDPPGCEDQGIAIFSPPN